MIDEAPCPKRIYAPGRGLFTVDGERFTVDRGRFTVDGERFTDISEHFTDVGEPFTDISEHFTDVGEPFTDISERFTVDRERLIIYNETDKTTCPYPGLTGPAHLCEYGTMNIEDLRETAALARLRLSDEELQGAFPSFQQMLGFFAAMQAASEDRDAFPVPLSAAWAGLAPNSRVVDARCLRADTPNLPNATLTTSLLNNAGERDGRFIVAPNVL